jgi:hypothetical protein
MNDKEAMTQLMDWVELLLLRSWIQGLLLDKYSPVNWRELVQEKEILFAPLLRARIASIRAAFLEENPTPVGRQDWQEIAERLIRSAEIPEE